MSGYDPKEMRPENVASHVRETMNSVGWALMLANWNSNREMIIAEGKKCRAEEKKIKMWAKLDGFDEAVESADYRTLAAASNEAAINSIQHNAGFLIGMEVFINLDETDCEVEDEESKGQE